MTQRIGIVGGTFDPIHNGHLVAMHAAREQLAFDRTIIMVAADPWQKTPTPGVSAQQRLAMARAACATIDGVEVSDREIVRGGPTYTIDSVVELRTATTMSNVAEIMVVLGADALQRVDTWHRADELSHLVTIAALHRRDEVPAAPSQRWNVVSVAMPRLDISSTDIRERVASGRPIDGLAPECVVQIINEYGLYR